MTASTSFSAFTPRYEQRVKLVQGIVQSHTKLDDTAASDLAVQMLHALDTIPEKLR